MSPATGQLVRYTRAVLQLRETVVFSSKRKSSVYPGIEHLQHLLHYISENVRMRDETPGIQDTPKTEKQNQTNKKKLKSVSSTSRRGARAAYHDEYPRDFGPRIAYTLS